MKLKFSLLITLLGFFSCGKVENSNSVDKFIYGGGALSGSPQFVAAATIINQRCATCHTHAQWKNYSQADYIANGLVVSQSPADSSIYYRNSNATSGPGPNNMPTGGNPDLTNAELSTLITWINSF